MALAFSGNLAAGLADEAATFGAAFATLEQREGMRAFIEKRQPTFEQKTGSG
jgi:enoyl-CoA hydratase/carnithine racemase